jgi:hypothetical protein
MASCGKSLNPSVYGVFAPPFERAILGRFLGWDADRIPELFIGEVVIPEEVDVLP